MDWIKKIGSFFLQTPTLISILAGFGLVIWQVLSGTIPPSVQITFFIFFLALTGIPHGAIDHLIEAETAKRQQKKFKIAFFLVKYVLTMLVYAFAWYVLPSLSLLFFLLISAWHFGETDIEYAPKTVLWNATRFIFGCFVLSFLLLFHEAETTPILERISQNNFNVLAVWFYLISFKNSLLLISFLIVLILFYLANKNQLIELNKTHYFRLFLIILLTYFLPLLPAFALYFGGWHALCSFKTIHFYISENNKNAQSFSPISFLKTWSKTLVFSILAISSLIFATWYWFRFLQTFDPLPLLFIFLSLITLPHLTVMHKIN
jgi:beta-carotene 15,15'-dioxygenase